jgi:hypothetical protein
MDTALALKIKIADHSITSFKEAKPYLEKSVVFQHLLEEIEDTALHLLHRLIQLAEIPYSHEFEKVQKWRDDLARLTFCGEGFSLTGKKEDVLACYNAMITTVLIKFDYPEMEQIEKGIAWILNYQNVERAQINKWEGKGIQKYGGCMKSTPCFIGVAKSMITLTTFKKKSTQTNPALDEKLKKGLEYILEHAVYKRKSTDKPITKEITKLVYPFTYKTNIIELLRLLSDNDCLDDERTSAAKELLYKKQKKDGFWRSNAFYKPKYWVDFDKTGDKAEWLSFEITNSIYKH